MIPLLHDQSGDRNCDDCGITQCSGKSQTLFSRPIETGSSLRRRWRTSLYGRFTLIYAATILAIAVLAVVFGQIFVQPQIQKLQERENRFHRVTVEHGLEAKREKLAGMAQTYGVWDDAHDYLAGRNPNFPNKNVNPNLLSPIGMDAVVILDAKGAVRYQAASKTADIAPGILQEMTRALASAPGLSLSSPNEEKSGLVVWDNHAMLVAVHPVIRSDGAGRPNGALAFARILGPKQRELLAHEAGDPLHFHHTSASGAMIGVSKAAHDAEGAKADHPSIRTSVTFKDVYGDNALYIEIIGQQEVIALGRSADASFIMLMALLLVTLPLAFGWFLRRALSDPIQNLVKRVDDISHGREVGDLDANMPSDITDLAIAFDCAFSRANTEAALHRHAAKRETEAKLTAQAAQRAAEDANAAKSEFLAGMNHELRTPLTSIIAYAEMLRESAEEDSRETDITDSEIVLSASRHLLTLINDMLDLAKIDAKRMDVEAAEFDVKAFAQDIERTARPLASANGNSLTVSIGSDVGIAFSDAFKLKQCLLNLLSNAAKFTHNGEIKFTVSATSKNGAPVLAFAVSDTGIGISADKLAQLFQPFRQADSSMARKYGGTGLGLYLSQNLARLIGGDISVTSQEGAGSTFLLEAPARYIAPETAQSIPPTNEPNAQPQGIAA